jgi:hypothetical protein
MTQEAAPSDPMEILAETTVVASQVVEEAVAAAGRGHGQGDGREQQSCRCRGKRWRTRLLFEAVARTKWYCLLMREVGGVTRDGNKCSPIEYL